MVGRIELILSRRSQYAIRSLIVIANADGRIKRRQIASIMGVPATALVQALAGLHRAGLIAARAGPDGGYERCRPMSQITLAEVV